MGLHQNRDIEILLTKYLDKNCAPQEKQLFYELISSNDNEKIFKEILLLHLNEFNEDQYNNNDISFDHIYNQIMSEINLLESMESEKRLLKRKKMVRQLLTRGLSLAAVFCIAFFLGGLFRERDSNILSEPAIEYTYSEITTPLGARSQIKLADGTSVILNAGSTLKYRNDYNLKNRDLILDGEAYFKVAKNTEMPLIVNAGSINIKATGTEFNVKAYSDEGIVETTLIEGKVEISQNDSVGGNKLIELEPNQKAIYVKNSDRILIDRIKEAEPSAVKSVKVASDKLLVSPKVDVEQVTAWTQNRLIIRGEDLENLCIKLQRKYDVNFVFGNDEIKNFHFTGVLRDETLEQVLNVIKLTAPVNYVIDGKIVLLVSNKEQVGKYSKYLKKE